MNDCVLTTIKRSTPKNSRDTQKNGAVNSAELVEASPFNALNLSLIRVHLYPVKARWNEAGRSCRKWELLEAILFFVGVRLPH